MNHRRLHGPDEFEQRGGDAGNVNDADADDEILFDRAVGALGDGAGLQNLSEVVGHQGNIGCLDGGLCAGDAHGDSHVGNGKRRRVVDAVADHRHAVALTLQLLDDAHLLLGQQVREDFIDAEVACDRSGDRGVVASQHHEALDAVLPQEIEARFCASARNVREPNGADELSVRGDKNRRALRLGRGMRDVVLIEQRRIPDHDPRAVDGGPHAPTADDFKVRWLRHLDAAFFRALDDGLRKRMTGAPFGRRGEPE